MVKTEKNLRDSYKTYVKSSENPVDIKTYLIVAANYNRFMIEKVLGGDEVVMPMKTGTLSIIGTIPVIKFDEDGVPNLAVDWQRTWQLWKKDEKAKAERKKLYHTNDHTEGVRYRYLWSKKRIYATNKNLYALRLTRDNKRAVPEMVAGGKEYYVKK